MAKTRRKSAGNTINGKKGRIKTKAPKGGGDTPKQDQSIKVTIKRKRQTRAQKLKTDMQFAISHLDEAKDTFVANRTFSVSKFDSAKNIQVTCRNDDTPQSTSINSQSDSQPDQDLGNLSLASYGKKLLKRKLSFARKIFQNEDHTAPSSSSTVDNSLIIIDDDSSNDTNEVVGTCDEIVDLTTPQPTPAKNITSNQPVRVQNPVIDLTTQTPAKNNSPNKQVQVLNVQNPFVDLTTPQPGPAKTNTSSQQVQVWTPPNPLEQITSNPHPFIQQQLFPPIPRLTQPFTPVFQPAIPVAWELFGSNFLNAGSVRTIGLRPIFIDGNNIALGHSNGKFFSVKGLKICIDYFKIRGHEVTAIVPQIKKRRNQNSDPNLLMKLESEGSVVFTPSRVINGRNVIPYDDRFIVQLAAVHFGVIVSCDNYRDLLAENPNLRDTIENRVLNPTFVKDMLIFPSDPLGRWGPKLDEFLRFP